MTERWRNKLRATMKELGVPAPASGNPDVPLSFSKADQAAATVALSVATGANNLSPRVATEACSGVRDRASCFSCCTALLNRCTPYKLAVFLVCGVVCGKLFPPVSTWYPGPAPSGR